MLTLAGKVVAAAATSGGEWTRLHVALTGGKTVATVMVKGEAPEVGAEVSLAVRTSVETDGQGRPRWSVVYWPVDVDGAA